MMQKNITEQIYYTDGWHPTVNPSSRMVVHHFRFIELLHTDRGILNEFPRRRGGCTLRFLRFSGQDFQVLELPASFEFVPWWLPSSYETAQAFLFPLYEQALKGHENLTKQEIQALEKILFRLQELVRSNGEHTLGEILNSVNEDYYREILPEMPSLELVSLTRHPLRHLFAEILRHSITDATLHDLLSAWATKTNAEGFTMLAVGHSAENNLYRVSWSQREKSLAMVSFDPLTGKSISPRLFIDVDWLAGQLDSGLLIPGSRLVSLMEVLLRCEGREVLHFGNNYGRVEEIARILVENGYTVPFSAKDITFVEDDADSWHVGVIRNQSQSYPLHLLDMMSCVQQTHVVLQNYVHQSLEHQVPVILVPGRSLDETISA